MKSDKIIYLILGGIAISTSIFLGYSMNNSKKSLKELNFKTESSNTKLDDKVLNSKEVNKENEKYISYFSKLNIDINNISSEMDNSNGYFNIYLKNKDKSYLDKYINSNEVILNEIKNMSNAEPKGVKDNLDVQYIKDKIELLEKSFVEYNQIFKNIKASNGIVDDNTITNINSKSIEIANFINSYNELTKELANSYKLYVSPKGNIKVDKNTVITCNKDLLDTMSTMIITDSIFKKDFNPSPNMISALKDINRNSFMNSLNEINLLLPSFEADKQQYTEMDSLIKNAISYANNLNSYLDDISQGGTVESLKAERNNLLNQRKKLNNIYKVKLSIIENYKI